MTRTIVTCVYKDDRVNLLLRRLPFFSIFVILFFWPTTNVFPIIYCGISIWGCNSSKTRLICKAQNKVARIVFELEANSHCRGNFLDNNILTFKWLNSHLFDLLKKSKTLFKEFGHEVWFRVSNVLVVPHHNTMCLNNRHCPDMYCCSITIFNKSPSLLKRKCCIFLKRVDIFSYW